MRNCYSIIAACAISSAMLAQPDQWPVAIDPGEIGDLQASRRVIDMFRAPAGKSPVVDGEMDSVWKYVTPASYDRYVTYHTVFENNAYKKISDLSDGAKPLYRTPDSEDDFSGTYRIMYDEDNIYCLLEITDNEINDNNLNAGVKESFEFQEAPYPDSAQQMLNGNPYPPYTGKAGELNKKYCYWAYLGAFKFWFFLAADGKCTGEIREKPNTTKINYEQRLQSCGCAWKSNSEGSGYSAEISISLKVALADSANNPYRIPVNKGDTQCIAFEMKCYDEDYGMLPIQASWNSQDDNVWDAMVYAGKLMMKGWSVGNDMPKNDNLTVYPNPATDAIIFNKTIERADIISVEGIPVCSCTFCNRISVAELPSGFYILHTESENISFIKK